MTSIWRFNVNGVDYEVDPDTDLTVSRLLHFQQWYGDDFGSFLPFVNAAMRGDPRALACALWIGRKKIGENAPEPRRSDDFSVGDVLAQILEGLTEQMAAEADAAEADAAADPTPGATPNLPTPDSPSLSETSTPDTSPESATSAT